MNDAAIVANVIDLAAYRAARAAERRLAELTVYELWSPDVGPLGHDTIVVPASH
jgi:hypothetical protein